MGRGTQVKYAIVPDSPPAMNFEPTEDQKERYLKRLLSGEGVVAVDGLLVSRDH